LDKGIGLVSVGTAIVLVAVFAIIVWQVDKHGVWKKAGKGVLWCVLAIAIVMGGVAGYYYLHDLSEERELAERLDKERQDVATHGIDSYLGVRLDMSNEEVLYVLGVPEYPPGLTSHLLEARVWRYSNHDGKENTVELWFHGNDSLLSIACEGHSPVDCPPLGGIAIGDLESFVTERLGPPSSQGSFGNIGAKWLVYGPKTRQVRFRLTRGAVDTLSIMTK
jgi:hypothetical protein